MGSGEKKHGLRKLKTSNTIREKGGGGGKGNETRKDGDEGKILWRLGEEY